MPVDRSFGKSFVFKWWGAFIVSTTIVVLATLPPFLPAEWRTLLMMSFSKICHQGPDRSPHLSGIALGVCHRCYGVYLGLPLAAVGFFLLYRLPVSASFLRILLFVALALLSLDWGAPLLGFWHNTAFTRMFTGLFFGLVAGYYLVYVLSAQSKSVSPPP